MNHIKGQTYSGCGAVLMYLVMNEKYLIQVTSLHPVLNIERIGKCRFIC